MEGNETMRQLELPRDEIEYEEEKLARTKQQRCYILPPL
jgi:hypothetical protein